MSNMPVISSRMRDLTGCVFGRLTVTRLHSVTAHSTAKWLCRCTCGNQKPVVGSSLTSGVTVSCGCQKLESATSHKQSGGAHGKPSPEYEAWGRMLYRCNTPTCAAWDDYGGRGISVCERWHSFENFLEDMGRRPSPKHSIDRFPNNDGNYEPSNCRWATAKEQTRNRRTSKMISFQGETLCAAEWAERIGVKYGTFLKRLGKWPIEKAITWRGKAV